MSEFGNETATATFKAGEKTMEALMKLLKFLMERNQNKVNNQIKKEQLMDMKTTSEQRKAQRSLTNRTGYVNAKNLYKSGEKLRPLSVALSNEEMKRFSYYAKKYGILYTSISNQQQDGVKDRIVIVREKDLSLIKDITDRMNEEIKLESIEKQITELENKANKTDGDIDKLNEFYKEKDETLRAGTREFNDENAEIIFNDVCGEMQNQSMVFDRALNRFTDRDFSKDKPYFVCERTNPTSYIELNSTYAEFAGEKYTRTDYKVFNNDEEQTADYDLRADGKFTDERFEGRPKGYWQTLKNDMKVKGGFTDDMVIFNTKTELERYQQLYAKEVQEKTVEKKTIVEDKSYRDFTSIDTQLRDQLNKNNAELNTQGIAVDKITKEVLTIKPTDITIEKLRAAESILIAKQIENYKNMNQVQTTRAIDLQEYNVYQNSINNIPDNDAAKRDSYKKMQSEIGNKILHSDKSLMGGELLEMQLEQSRNMVSSIDAVNEVNKEYIAIMLEKATEENVINVGHEENKDERDTQTMDKWKEQIDEERQSMSINNPVAEKSDINLSKSAPSKDDR